MSELVPMIKEAMFHAHTRKESLPKKLDALTLKGEIQVAHILGELSGVERILEFIVKKKDTLTIADLEAEIHVYLVAGLNEVSKHYFGKPSFGIENVLRAHGYYEKYKEVSQS